MLHHVSVGVADVERAAKFYDAVLKALGYKRIMEFLPYAIGYGETGPEFWVQLPHDQQSASNGNGAHVGFVARSKRHVHKFHETALAEGGTDNGAPGPRPDYGPEYYGAFVIDLDGNKLEATYLVEAKPAKAAAKKAKKKAKPAKKAAKKVAKKAKKAAKAKKKAKRKARK
ncbi:MAG TPA: VOC family protein [Rhizomicrobium sp.]|jgi:catechol 2,3-dioxygenase-like lactoylglutathione lyase family enzyme|nr:VOC family protein [Rhizomicrobium sp.]